MVYLMLNICPLIHCVRIGSPLQYATNQAHNNTSFKLIFLETKKSNFPIFVHLPNLTSKNKIHLHLSC